MSIFGNAATPSLIRPAAESSFPANQINMLFRHFRSAVIDGIDRLTAAGSLPAGLDTGNVNAEPPRDPSHGDIATNAALVLAKQAKAKPRDIAEALAAVLAEDEAVEAVLSDGRIN